MNKYLLWLVFLSVVTVAVITYQYFDDSAYLVACDVGQGDALLLQKGLSQVLVDTGPNNGGVLECLGKSMPFWDRTLEVMVLSHPQADHMGAAGVILQRYRVKQVIVPDVVNNTEGFWELVNLLDEKGVDVAVATRGLRVTVEGIEGEVVWPEVAYGRSQMWRKETIIMNQSISDNVLGMYDAAQPKDVNEASIVMIFRLEGVEGMVTGDISVEVEEALLGEGVIRDVGWLKVPHHGSKSSNSEKFLFRADPELALIMVGKNNRYGHPHKEVLDRLVEVGAKVLRTDEQGLIRVRVKNGTMEYTP